MWQYNYPSTRRIKVIIEVGRNTASLAQFSPNLKDDFSLFGVFLELFVLNLSEAERHCVYSKVQQTIHSVLVILDDERKVHQGEPSPWFAQMGRQSSRLCVSWRYGRGNRVKRLDRRTFCGRWREGRFQCTILQGFTRRIVLGCKKWAWIFRNGLSAGCSSWPHYAAKWKNLHAF